MTWNLVPAGEHGQEARYLVPAALTTVLSALTCISDFGVSAIPIGEGENRRVFEG